MELKHCCECWGGYELKLISKSSGSSIEEQTAIKLNTMPTSINDYDYYTQGSGVLYNSSGETVDSPTIPNVTKVYVWAKRKDGYCSYGFNTETSTQGKILFNNAIEFALEGNSTLYIYSKGISIT